MDPETYYKHRFREQLNEWAIKVNAHTHPNEGVYIPIQDLKAENLSHIPKEDLMLFHCALACAVLIDQVIYTHFNEEYPTFKEMTLYPKIEYGITNTNVNPWDITHSGIGLTTLERFVNFFVLDLKDFFTRQSFKSATWESVKQAMLSDGHVVSGPRGEIFKTALEKV